MIKKIILSGSTLLVVGISHIYADNLLNSVFRPSIERGTTIDVGSTAEQVGGTFFEGKTRYKATIGKNGKPHACYIRNSVLESTSQEGCKGKGSRQPYEYKGYKASECVNTNAIPIGTDEKSCTEGGKISGRKCRIAGRAVHLNTIDETNCGSQKGDRRVLDGKDGWFNKTNEDPLMVRVTKLLLQITITLSITFILYNAIQYALAMTDSGKTAETQKKLINIAIGVAIALSSLGIIYLIQSIINKSIF